LVPGHRFITNSAATLDLNSITSFKLQEKIVNNNSCAGYLPEEELTIKIRQVNPIKVDDSDVFDTGHGEVFEDFAPKTTGADD
jgi:hypothetical protein